MTTSTHARLSPSSADRWMACLGSLAMEEQFPTERQSNDFADEGTAAHELASWALENEVRCEAYVGQKAKNGWKITEDMAEDVQSYADRVKDYQSDGRLFIEQRLRIEHITGEKGAEGTADAVIISSDLQEITIMDLKFGRGIKIDAEENKQLMMYALAALEQYSMLGNFQRVRLVIHQPRLNHLSEWDISIDGLREFYREAQSAAEFALEIAQDANSAEYAAQHLNPGEKQCQWCKAKATCPALAKYVTDSVGADFLDMTIVNDVHTLVPRGTHTLADKMGAIGMVEMWCRAVRAEVERTLLEGREVEGYKVVQGKQGNRQWTDKEIAEEVLKKMRLKKDEMYNFNLISPTDAEKVLKKNPGQWKKVQEYITRAEGKLSVAPASDPRPAVSVKPVEEDFVDESHPGSAFA